ncbi:hypothetical protein BZA77DRAFT_297774 [Pyronema omphalodes]|nr:hypothetical protein BZA77DRAFT_297774 [Pyronema omphalodes]
MQTKFITLLLLSVAGAFAQQDQPGLGDAFSVVGTVVQDKASSFTSQIAADATSKIGANIASVTSAIPGAIASGTAHIGSDFNHATGVIASVGSKFSSVAGFSNIEDQLKSAIAQGTGAVASLLSTQTAIVGAAATSLEADVARAIISAATKTGSPQPTTSGNSAPKLMAGSAAGVVGILAVALAL